MAEKNNAVCSICGNSYYVCLACRDSVKANPWKVHTDTAEHYKVYQVVHGLSTGVYTESEAKDRLKNIDLSDLNTFRPHIKKIVKDILKKGEQPVIKVVEKDGSKEESVEAEITEIKEEKEELVVEPIISRKRNFKQKQDNY